MKLKYKLKPLEIEAIQYYPTECCHKELKKWGLEFEIDMRNRNLPTLKISTIRGIRIAFEGDYIVKRKEGDFYPCCASDFFKFYEKV